MKQIFEMFILATQNTYNSFDCFHSSMNIKYLFLYIYKKRFLPRFYKSIIWIVIFPPSAFRYLNRCTYEVISCSVFIQIMFYTYDTTYWMVAFIYFLYDSHHKCNTRRDVMRYEVIYTALGGTPTPMTSGDHYH